jgi:DNA-directed RNA polymerase specialized sigma24 family protein
VQYDRQIIAAVTAEDPASMALMYDKYDSADAAGALQNTFVSAATTLGDLSEPSKLRPWLFALARDECRPDFCRAARAARDLTCPSRIA